MKIRYDTALAVLNRLTTARHSNHAGRIGPGVEGSQRCPSQHTNKKDGHDEAADAQFAMRTVRGIISRRTIRSEEHTSELQSLMRISYAVFCLQKKKTNNNRTERRKQAKKKKHSSEEH